MLYNNLKTLKNSTMSSISIPNIIANWPVEFRSAMQNIFGNERVVVDMYDPEGNETHEIISILGY